MRCLRFIPILHPPRIAPTSAIHEAVGAAVSNAGVVGTKTSFLVLTRASGLAAAFGAAGELFRFRQKDLPTYVLLPH